jgi:hypothetical protein
LRSLLKPAPAADPGDPPVTAPESTGAPGPATPHQAGHAQQLQVRLYETTERLAIALIERAEKDLISPAADGKGPSVRELQGVVEYCMNLLVKLPKLKPDDESEDAGVAVLQAAMTDPTKIVDRLQANPKFIDALRAKGWLPPPAKVNHRPTKEQVQQREEYAARKADLGEDTDEDEDDDSELQRRLQALNTRDPA